MAEKIKEDKEQAVVSVPVKWTKQEQYTFVGVKLTSKKRTLKKVYRGHFETSAPAGLEPGVEYCLKIITLNHMEQEYPQFREHFDVLDFEGDHLRKILAKNPAAMEVERTVRDHRTYEDAPICILVEPVYESAETFFEQCASKSVEERLDVLKQYALGCRELRDRKNMIAGKIIVAHRDIKMENGMFSKEGGRWVIRLIDFASIRLDGDPDREEPEQEQEEKSDPVVDSSADRTAAFVASAANTAPEDVWLKEGFEPSDKTDVYALGMMLGRLFLKINGKIGSLASTPSYVWAKESGWNPKSLDDSREKLSRAFEQGLKLDQNDKWEGKSWIERTLQSMDYQLKWETTAIPKVQDEIRKLFFDATRICPDERKVDLGGFIARLTEIEEMLKGRSARLPLSVYLFDRTDMHLHKNAYFPAVRETYAEECGEAKTSRKVAPQVLCLSYGRAGIGEAVLARTDLLDGNVNICDTSDELASYLRKLEPNVGGEGPYPLNYAICSACNYLDKNREKYRFTGKIHLFLPSIPAYEDIALIPLQENMVIDLSGLCMTLNDVLNVMPHIYVHTYSDNRRDSDDPEWYSFEAFRGASSYQPPRQEFVYEPAPAPQPPTEDPAGPAAQVHRQEKPRKTESRFLTGPGAAYITTRSGHKLYVGQRKEHH